MFKSVVMAALGLLFAGTAFAQDCPLTENLQVPALSAPIVITNPDGSTWTENIPSTATVGTLQLSCPPTQLAAGTYWLGVTQGSNTVGIDINNGAPKAYVPGSASYPAEAFVWNGSGQLQKHDCANAYLADSNGSMVCKATQTDTFRILPVSGGITIYDQTAGQYLQVTGTCATGFSTCVGFVTNPATPTVWTEQPGA